jgi:LysR family transcriptional regulator, transcriptional activator of the cysJI operon
VDLEHLSLFSAIVSRRSVSRGARDHGVTQSAASQVVQEFERALHVQLLDRSRRPLQITRAGRLFHDFASEVLERRQRLLAALDDLREDTSGVVRVASIYSIGLSEMSRLEKAFLDRLPEGRLQVDYLRPDKVYEVVADGRADLGLVSYPETGRGLVVRKWRQELLVLAAAPTHPLARFSRIRLSALDQAEFIGFDADLPISRHIERILQEAGAEVRCRVRFDNIQSMKEGLLAGRAVAILPAPMLRAETAEGRLKAIRLVPSPLRPLGIVHRKRPLGKAVRVFVEVLTQRAPANGEPVSRLRAHGSGPEGRPPAAAARVTPPPAASRKPQAV